MNTGVTIVKLSRLLDFIRKAQNDLLPVDRRRQMNGLTHAGPIVKYLGLTVTDTGPKQTRRKKKTEDLCKVEPPLPIALLLPPEVQEFVKQLVEEQVAITLNKFLHDLVDKVVPVEKPVTAPTAPAANESFKKEAYKQVVVGKKTTTVRRKTILLCGLLPAQAGEIKKTFQDRAVDFKFWFMGHSLKQLAASAASADAVIAMVDKFSHSAQDQIRKVGALYHPVHGGVGHIKATIEQLL